MCPNHRHSSLIALNEEDPNKITKEKLPSGKLGLDLQSALSLFSRPMATHRCGGKSENDGRGWLCLLFDEEKKKKDRAGGESLKYWEGWA